MHYINKYDDVADIPFGLILSYLNVPIESESDKEIVVYVREDKFEILKDTNKFMAYDFEGDVIQFVKIYGTA